MSSAAVLIGALRVNTVIIYIVVSNVSHNFVNMQGILTNNYNRLKNSFIERTVAPINKIFMHVEES